MSSSHCYKKECCEWHYNYNAQANAQVTIPFEPTPTLSLEKQGQPATFSGAGQQITYTYTVTNTGNAPLDPVTVEDDLVQVACSAGSLPVGQSMTCTGSYTTTEADVARGQVTNQAQATGKAVASEPSFRKTATAQDSFTVAFVPQPSLEMTKHASPSVYSQVGALITYEYKVTNTGDVPVSGPFVLEDNRAIEFWNCQSLASLGPGETMTCQGFYRITAEDYCGTVTNTATVSGQYQGQTVRSNSDSASVFCQPPKDKSGSDEIPQ
ncbi:MAG: DUF7507 domain-containing protein [Chloroflexota bacterium]